MNVLQVDGLSKRIGEEKVVNNINFHLSEGQKMGVAGETGSGKSSLLKMIAGLMQPDEGSIYFQGKRVEGPDEKLIPGHRSIGYLSQHFELRNNYKVYELLEMSNQLSENEAKAIYKICDIEPFLKRWSDELSGGEKQRIALAKILVAGPKLLLLDEPFSNMDVIHKSQLQKAIQRISKDLNLSCIMVSHDAADLLSWADELYIMKKAAFVQKGKPLQVYQQPINEYCAELLGAYNWLDTSSSLFSALHALFPKATQWMIRPENILIDKTDGILLEGKVTAVYFKGAYSLLYVSVGNSILKVQTGKHDLRVDDLIRLSISSEAIHVISSI